MSTTRNPQSDAKPILNRDATLDKWALSHYKPAQEKLDLSFSDFWHIKGIFGTSYLDPSFKYKLPTFLKNIGSFLEDYDYIKAFSLYAMKDFWNPYAAMPQISANKHLHTLDLSITGVTEAQIKELLNNPHLVNLKITGNGLVNLAFKENRSLKTLNVAANALNSYAIAAISDLENLESLNINHNHLNDKLVDELLTKLTHLKRIDLEHTGITKATAKALLKNTQLTEIHVSCQDVNLWNQIKLYFHARQNRKREAKLSESKAGMFQPANSLVKAAPSVDSPKTFRSLP